ncbi:head GIN domain-containing protein [Sphingobium bisphenolivorans]|uniref:head GIN domain-containing protein n=1 Tax=Sphingobium bisphenolivorans TaxID=1335760 RepID=UPI00039DD86B|nr:head GIN domain-containing protein [Sphingobium bisphenolivorans]
MILARFILLTVVGLAAPAQAATRGFTVTSFDAIRVDAPIEVIVTTGAGASARSEGDQQLLDRLKVDVSGRLLTITMERPRPGEKSGGRALLRLSTGNLMRVVLIGGGSISINRMKGLRGEIILGGNGDVSVAAVDLDQLNLGVAGAGRATLAGRAGVATVRVNGPGAVAAEGLHARQATVAIDGPGTVTLTADVTAKVSASGSGDVTVIGKAACSVDNRGTGRISCGGAAY